MGRVPHVSLDELAVSILPGKSPSRLAHWNATWWSHLQGNSSLLRPGGHDRDGGILRAYCTNLGPVGVCAGQGLASWCPRQDSNLRHRLRRAVLYPLSYGGLHPFPDVGKARCQPFTRTAKISSLG